MSTQAEIMINGQIWDMNVDVCGNFYLSRDDKSYQLNFDGLGIPYFENGSFDIVEQCEPNFGKIKQDANTKNEEFFREDDGYKFVHDEQNELDFGQEYDEMNEYVTCYDNGSGIKPCYRKNGLFVALYEVYIYDEKNNLIFRTKIINGMCIYKICIYKNGDVHFRPVSKKVSECRKLKIEKEQLIIF